MAEERGSPPRWPRTTRGFRERGGEEEPRIQLPSNFQVTSKPRLCAWDDAVGAAVQREREAVANRRIEREDGHDLHAPALWPASVVPVCVCSRVSDSVHCRASSGGLLLAVYIYMIKSKRSTRRSLPEPEWAAPLSCQNRICMKNQTSETTFQKTPKREKSHESRPTRLSGYGLHPLAVARLS